MRRFLLWVALSVPLVALSATPDSIHRSGVEACPTPSQFCPDVDLDTFGDTAFCILTCEPLYDFSLSAGGDCNNDSAAVNPAATELCNGIDDDCDLNIDEGNPGGGGTCISGFPGVCAAGTRLCSSGALQCTPNVAPGSQTETCNGLDDDCDGLQDEDNAGGGNACVRPGFVGICQFGTQQCTSGALVCAGTEPGTVMELCNGQDDDCNGTIDDPALLNGLPCSTGFPGVCNAGTQFCVAATFSCNPNIVPGSQTEICNGQDDDCDGQQDEGNPGGGVACNTGLLGICSTGIRICNSGTLQCPPNVVPGSQTEVCNGLDDDCDGQLDEGNPGGGVPCNTGLGGMCANGTRQCQSGMLVCVPPGGC